MGLDLFLNKDFGYFIHTSDWEVLQVLFSGWENADVLKCRFYLYSECVMRQIDQTAAPVEMIVCFSVSKRPSLPQQPSRSL